MEDRANEREAYYPFGKSSRALLDDTTILSKWLAKTMSRAASCGAGRVDAQREKLTGQLGELEATERVLARYSKGRQAKKAVSARTANTATGAAAPAQQRGRTTPAKPAGGKRASPTLGEQVLALADGKTQQEITALGGPAAATRFAQDSLQEEAGFEPSVPRLG